MLDDGMWNANMISRIVKIEICLCEFASHVMDFIQDIEGNNDRFGSVPVKSTKVNKNTNDY